MGRQPSRHERVSSAPSCSVQPNIGGARFPCVSASLTQGHLLDIRRIESIGIGKKQFSQCGIESGADVVAGDPLVGIALSVVSLQTVLEDETVSGDLRLHSQDVGNFR